MSFITTVFYLWILNSFFYIFFQKRKLNVFVISCVWIAFYLLHYYGLAQISNPYVTFILSCLLFMILCRILYLGPNKKIIYVCMLGQTTGMIIEIIVFFFLIYVNYTEIGRASVGSLVSKLIMLSIIHAIVILKKQPIYTEPSTFYWLLLIATTVSSISIVYILFSIASLPSAMTTISTVALLCINMSHFIIYNKLSETTDILLKNQIMQQQINHYKTHFSELKIQDSYLRKERHNLKNQLIIIREYATKNLNSQIINFTSKLLNEREFGLSTFTSCDNILINTLLNSKNTIACENNINYSLDLKVPPTLPFDDVDLCILIGNALDNSFEAILSNTNPAPFVNVTIHYTNGCLYCHFSNSYSDSLHPDSTYLFLSKKRAELGPGYGLYSIKNIVEKYNGIMQIDTENSIFSLKLSLYVR